MMAVSLLDLTLSCPTQADIDQFRQLGVTAIDLATPVAMKVAEPAAPGSKRWFAFEADDLDDVALWHMPTGAVRSSRGQVFALGETIVDETATYSFNCALNIYDSPLDWLRARRDGIVVIDWARAFDRLRDAPRITLAERLLPLYRRHMRPARMPALFIMPQKKEAA